MKPGAIFVNRNDKLTKTAAWSIGDVQQPKHDLAKHMCKRRHVWIRSKYNLRCSRCGLEVERVPQT